jgi:hypothetical protein
MAEFALATPAETAASELGHYFVIGDLAVAIAVERLQRGGCIGDLC